MKPGDRTDSAVGPLDGAGKNVKKTGKFVKEFGTVRTVIKKVYDPIVHVIRNSQTVAAAEGCLTSSNLSAVVLWDARVAWTALTSWKPDDVNAHQQRQDPPSCWQEWWTPPWSRQENGLQPISGWIIQQQRAESCQTKYCRWSVVDSQRMTCLAAAGWRWWRRRPTLVRSCWVTPKAEHSETLATTHWRCWDAPSRISQWRIDWLVRRQMLD